MSLAGHLLLTILGLSGLFVFSERQLNVPRHLVPAFTLFGIISWLHIGLCLDVLPYGTWGLYILSLGALIYNAIRVRHVGKLFGVEYRYFWLFALMLLSVCFSSFYHTWDEFSHWGLVPKTLLLHKSWITFQVGCREYPPGSGLMHSFICSLMGGFHEGITYWSMSLLLLSLWFVFLGKLRWNRLPHVWILLCVSTYVLWMHFTGIRTRWFLLGIGVGFGLYCLFKNKDNRLRLLPYALFVHLWIYLIFFSAFGASVRSLYVDLLLAATFAAAIVIYFTTDRLWMLPLLFALPAIKKSGLFLAALVLGFCLLDWAFQNGLLCFRKKTWPQWPRHALKKGLIWLALILTPFIATTLWHRVELSIKARQTFPLQPITPTRIATSFSPQATARDSLTIANFKKALTERNVAPGFKKYERIKRFLNHLMGISTPANSAWLLIVFTTVCFVLLGFWQRTWMQKGRLWLFAGSFLVGLALYACSLLVLYLYSFSEYEGVRLASFERYMSTYLLAGILIVFAFMTRSLTRKRAWIPLLFFCFLWTSLRPVDYRNLWNTIPKPGDRQITEDLLLEFPNIPPKARVFMVWQNSSGIQSLFARFGLFPRVLSCYSLGAPYSDKDIWTQNWTPEQLSGTLKQFDYLLLANVDDRFWHDYGHLFAEKNQKGHWYILTKEAANLRIAPMPN